MKSSEHQEIQTMTHAKEWLTATSTPKLDADTLKLYKSCGIDGIEISLPWNQYDQLDLPQTVRNAKEADITICSMHLPFSREISIATLNAEHRAAAIAMQRRLIAYGAENGIHRFILHPSSEPIADEDRPQAMQLAKEALAELAEWADEHGSVICVEDLPRTCLGRTADEMLELLSADERLRVCFDVNHLLTSNGSTHAECIQKLGSRIVTLHLSDYDFIDERHFLPGNGLINWNEVITLLEEADYCGPFLYEVSHTNAPGPLDYAQLRKRQLVIKEYCGQ